MKVLLCEDIRKLGWLGDVVEVAEGYARNYLLPQGKAKVATEGNIRAIAQAKAERAAERLKERKLLEAAAEAVGGAEAVLAAKANEHGVLFGSITEAMIAANLREQGFAVADDVVKLPAHIKQIGSHDVTLKFADEVTATVNVVVVPEKSEEDEASEGEEGQAAGEANEPSEEQ